MNNKEKQLFYTNAYLWFALAFLVTVAGFYPSYFSRLGEMSAAHHFHGISATLWMLLLVVQPFLYKTGLMKWHRLLGRLSIVLVVLIVIGGLLMVHMMLNNENYPPGLPYQLSFIDFFVIIQFILFYVLAIKNVRDTRYHARYMACTIFGPLIPAITRLLPNIGIVDTMQTPLHLSYVIVHVVLIILIIDDKRRDKIRLPYLLALGLMLLQHLTMVYAANWSWWQRLMDAYAGLPF
jgi:hypothetical protein